MVRRRPKALATLLMAAGEEITILRHGEPAARLTDEA